MDYSFFKNLNIYILNASEKRLKKQRKSRNYTKTCKMGPKNSKSKAQSIKYYHQYLDEQKHQIYEKHEEISSKMLELNSYSKKFNHALSPTEKCMSFCLDSMGMKEVFDKSMKNH